MPELTTIAAGGDAHDEQGQALVPASALKRHSTSCSAAIVAPTLIAVFIAIHTSGVVPELAEALATGTPAPWRMAFYSLALLMLPILFGIVCTQRAALCLCRQQLQDVYAQTPALLQVLDGQDLIVGVSHQWLQRLGYRQAEVSGRPLTRLLTPASRERFLRRQEDGLAADTLTLDFVAADGRILSFGLNEARMAARGSVPRRRVGVLTDLSPIKRVEAAMQLQASRDGVTGLLTRQSLTMAVSDHLRRHPEETISLALVDLDQFRRVNDTFGLEVGDSILAEAGRRLLATVRPSDLVGRLGGDEFAVLFRDLGDNPEAGARTASERLVRALRPAYCVGDLRLQVTGSLGLASHPKDGRDAATLFRHADLAVAAAKQAGRDQVHTFEPELQEKAEMRQRVEAAIRRALTETGFHWAFQPLFDLRTGQVCSVEALLRLNAPELGPISPATFIPIAEETGLLQAVWKRHVPELFRERRRWLDLLGDAAPRLSINLSAVQLHDETLDALSAARKRDTTAVTGTILELTESLLVEADAATLGLLDAFKRQGFAIALDDFGTGYSSLSALHRLPVDILKIDRAFTADLDHDSYGNAVGATMRGIVALAAERGMKVVAEGIETAEQLTLTKQLGIDIAQGFLLSRPLSPAALFEFLLTHEDQRATIAREGVLDGATATAAAMLNATPALPPISAPAADRSKRGHLVVLQGATANA